MLAPPSPNPRQSDEHRVFRSHTPSRASSRTVSRISVRNEVSDLEHLGYMPDIDPVKLEELRHSAQSLHDLVEAKEGNHMEEEKGFENFDDVEAIEADAKEPEPECPFKLFTKESWEFLLEREKMLVEKARLKKEGKTPVGKEARLVNGELVFEAEDDGETQEFTPELADGLKLPESMIDEFPPEYFGQPIEEIDKWIMDKTFVVITSRWGSKQINRFSATSSFFILAPWNPLRKLFLRITSHQLFDIFIFLVIMINVVFMILTGEYPEAEYLFLAIYTLELFLKVFSRGLVVNSYTYLRDVWSWLDVVVVLTSYLEFADLNISTQYLRAFRVFRILKTITIIPALKTILGAIIASLGMMIEVIVLTLFCMSVFALFGLQVYMGVMRNKCIERIDWKPLGNLSQHNISVIDNYYYDWISNPEHWYGSEGGYQPCGNITGSGNCNYTDPNYICIADMGPNPNYDYQNFDNFGWALFSIFQIVTLDNWEDLYNTVVRINGPWNVLFFIIVVFFGSFYLINLMLAVVTMSYEMQALQATKDEEKERRERLAKLKKNKNKELSGRDKKKKKKQEEMEARIKAKQEAKAKIEEDKLKKEEAERLKAEVLENKRKAKEADRDLAIYGKAKLTPEEIKKRSPYSKSQVLDASQNANDKSKAAGLKKSMNKEIEPGKANGKKQNGVILVSSKSGEDNEEDLKKKEEENAEGGVKTNAIDSGLGSQEDLKKVKTEEEELKELEEEGKEKVVFPIIIMNGDEELVDRNCPCCATVRESIYYPWLRFQNKMNWFVSDAFFEVFITLCICVNTIAMAAEHYPSSDNFDTFLVRSNFFFSTVFIVECVLKLLGMSRDYFNYPWNDFDFGIVLMSIVDLAVSDVQGLAVIRLFRLFRVFKLAQSWNTMRVLLSIILSALTALGSLTIILVIFLFIFALVGFQLFMGTYSNFYGEDMPRWNFEDFGHSLMMVFRILCGEWIEALEECMRPNGELCLIVFIPTLFLTNFIVLNLFLALLLNSFGSDKLKKPEEAEESKFSVAFNRIKGWILMCKERFKKVEETDDLSESGDTNKDSQESGRSSTFEFFHPGRNRHHHHHHGNHDRDVEMSSSREDCHGKNNGENGDVSTKRHIKDNETRHTKDMRDSKDNDKDGSHDKETQPNKDKDTKETKKEKTKKGSDVDSALGSNSSDPKQHLKKESEKIKKDSSKDDEKEVVTKQPKSKESKNDTKAEPSKKDADEVDGEDEENNVDEDDGEHRTVEDCCWEKCYEPCNSGKCDGCMCCFCDVETSYGLRWNNFRKAILRFTEFKAFEYFILVIIMASSITLCFEDIYLDKKPDMKFGLDIANYIFAAIFGIEMILKLFSLGTRIYFTEFWTLLDFIIVVITFMDIMISNVPSLNTNITFLKSLRTLRALRPLRSISRWEGMKIVVNALMFAIPAIVNVLLVCLVFWMIFSILGVQLFKGKFFKCLNVTTGERIDASIVPNQTVCMELNQTWQNSNINFDNSGAGLLALFQVATFEGWMELMEDAVDSTNIGEQPIKEQNIGYYAFFCIYIVFGAFFTLNLFIGVIIDNFQALKKKYEGNYLDVFLTENQRNYYNTVKKLANRIPQKTVRRPKDKCPAFFFDIAVSTKFEIGIVFIIFLNMFAMMAEHYNMARSLEKSLSMLNVIFTTIFTLEAVVKIIGLRGNYFRQAWNVYDFIIVILSILSIILVDLLSNVFVTPTLLRVIRIFRIGRILRVVKVAKGLRKLLFSLIMSLPALFNIGCLLLLIIFLYAIIGLSMFGNIKHTGAIDDIVNFQDFGSSMLLLIRLCTAGGWNDVLESLLVTPPECDPNYVYRNGETIEMSGGECGFPWFGIFYMVSYIFISYLIIINSYIAIILENFNSAHEQEDVGITEDDFELFYSVWERYDPYASQYIKLEDLSDFVADLDEPLGIPKPNIIALVSFDLAIVDGEKMHCLDILIALIRHVLGNCDDSEDFTKAKEQMEDMFKKTFPTRVHTQVISTTMRRKKEDIAAKTLQRSWRRHKAQRAFREVSQNAMGVSNMGLVMQSSIPPPGGQLFGSSASLTSLAKTQGIGEKTVDKVKLLPPPIISTDLFNSSIV